MKRIFIVIALITLLATFGFGQKKMSIEQSLMKMEQDLSDALVKRNTTAFDKYLDNDAVLTAPSGMSESKAQLVNEIKSGDLKFESSKIDDLKVKVFGNTAIVTYNTTDKATFKGQDISGHFRWTDTFIKMGSSWKLVASHGTPIM